MKLTQGFDVARPVKEVWDFLDQPEAVAGCVPGVEQLSVLSRDDIEVRITQSVGPMNATFAATVQITERQPEQRIVFTAQGKSVRGAMGNVRAAVIVGLAPSDSGTKVTVDGDVVLAGALGSVGQKVVAKQAGKVTAEFARNLAVALGAGPADSAAAAVLHGATGAAPSGVVPTGATTPAMKTFPPVSDPVPAPADLWVKASAALSLVAAAAAVGAFLRAGRSA